MADFERLLRGAIATRNASTPTQRREIYNSSRNALRRLIEENRSMTVETAMSEQRALEDAISKIEAEFVPATPSPPAEKKPEAKKDEDPFAELKQIIFEDKQNAAPSQTVPDAGNPAPTPTVVAVEPEAVASNGASQGSQHPPDGPNLAPAPPPGDSAQLPPEIAPEPDAARSNIPMEFARRRKSQKRLAYVIFAVVSLVVLIWLGVSLYSSVIEGSFVSSVIGSSENQATQGSEDADAARYINILEPGDLSTLVTANRGEAQIVNEQNLEMIRLVSVRDADSLSLPSKPILLRLKPGVLEQISGKRVTFEIFAKSGTSGPAQFTVKCQFGSLGDCGRKRFRVGIQPEASIFAFDFGTVSDLEHKAFIAINTDTTATAQSTGRGDVIDIVYARMRAN